MKPRAFALTYQGRKQTVYLKAAEENERLGFHDNLAHVSAFVKTESTDLLLPKSQYLV